MPSIGNSSQSRWDSDNAFENGSGGCADASIRCRRVVGSLPVIAFDPLISVVLKKITWQIPDLRTGFHCFARPVLP